MATLTSEERRKLSILQFGLPDKRKYPLIDEDHVRKAIQFFKFCPSSRRNELAQNINSRAKELGMKVKISKESTFYSYAHSTIIIESKDTPYEMDSLVERNIGMIMDIVTSIDKQTTLLMGKLVSKLFISPILEEFIDVEKKLQAILIDPKTMSKTFDKVLVGEHHLNPLKLVNDAMRKAYVVLFDFMNYNDPMFSNTFKDHKIIDRILEDIFFTIEVLINKEDPKGVSKRLVLLDEIINNFDCNNYYMVRKLKELEVTTNLRLLATLKHDDSLTPERQQKMIKIQEILLSHIDKTIKKCKPWDIGTVLHDRTISKVIQSGNLNLINTTQYLRTLKNELRSEIDIIKVDCGIETSYCNTFAENNFHVKDVIGEDHEEIISTLMCLEGRIRPKNIRLYNRTYSLELTNVDIIAFTQMNKFERLYIGKGYSDETVYYGISKDKLYLLTKTNKVGELVLVKLYDSRRLVNEMNLTSDPHEFDRSEKLPIISIKLNKQKDCILTEGISINAEGEVKFSFNPKKSYMDEYAENHKILVENFKLQNYEGMKMNLAFMFTLINNIERTIIYSKKNKKIKDDKRLDAEKARMFAINDFKTYLRHLQKVEPSFNFNKYYETSDFGKFIVDVNPDNIKGLRKLFQSIIIG